MVQTSVMTGFMELTPAQQLQFDRIKNSIQQEYVRFGFTPLDTPVLERAEALLAKAGGETEKQIYRFLKGDTDIALRFDLTVPLARYVADHYGSLVFPFRRSHIAKVYRGERPQRGRYREFYQCDIDVIGEDSLDIAYDAELTQVIYAIFSRLNEQLHFGGFTIKVNNRFILSGLLAHMQVQALTTDILRIIDKVEKITPDAFVAELEAIGLSNDHIQLITQFIGTKGDPRQVVAQLKALDISNELFTRGVSELETVVQLMEVLGVPAAYFAVDLSVARGLDYYTGTVYETVLNDYPQLGSVCSGGRYDDLASYYTKKRLPGVGVSIGLTRLFSQLLALGLVQTEQTTVADVLVLPLGREHLPIAAATAQTLRANGLCVDTFLEDSPIKKKFRYADRLGIATVVIIGNDEAANGTVTLQDMASGDKRQLTVEQACQELGTAVAR